MKVFQLKYRPQKISELDLENAREVLAKIVVSKNMPRALLFAGPKGSGKTSAARAVAMAVNCLEPKGAEACQKCVNCRELEKNNSLDIIEIDAASNRGIEDVRALKEGAYLAPSRLPNKVFIIDEVHMLTKEAFNALLKLIEEPPERTVFILCTTEPEKIPETILSRLTRVDFRRAKAAELKRSVEKIIKGESLEIAEEALDYLISKSDGSFRNIHKWLNELVVEFGKKISTEEVAAFYGRMGGGYEEKEFEKDLVAGKPAAILEKLEKMADSGVDFKLYRERLVAYFQKRLLACYGLGGEKSEMELGSLTRWLNLLVLAGRDEKIVELGQLPLELAVVEFLAEGNDGGGGEIKAIKDKKRVRKIQPVKVAAKVAAKINKKTAKKAKKVKVGKGEATEEVGLIKITEVEDKWGEVLAAVKPFNHSVEAFLRAVRPKMVSGGKLVAEVFYPFHKDKLEEDKNRQIVERGLKEALGADLIFECELGKKKPEEKVMVTEVKVKEAMTGGIEKEEVADEEKMYDVAKEIFG